MQPLAFAILKGLTPPDVETALYDERVEAIPDTISADLAAITVETFSARRAYQIAARLRRDGVPVVMGGYHPTLAPDEVLHHADAVVVGDAEDVWPRVVADARHAGLRRIYRQPTPDRNGGRRPTLSGLLYDRTIFHGKRYLPVNLVQFGRGCPNSCDFCAIRAFYGNRVARRPVREVVAEIERLPSGRLFFTDDNLFADIPAARRLFRALAERRRTLRWSCQSDLRVAGDDPMLALMAKSGCEALIIGFESLNRDNLAQMKKRPNLDAGDYRSAVSRIRKHGILIWGTFVFGYEHDTAAEIDASVNFAIDEKFYLANFNPLTPMPGTPLYKRLRAEKRLIRERWWLDPDFRYGQALFHPARISAEELEAGCFAARRAFYAGRSILSRAPGMPRHRRDLHQQALFWGSNLISRAEIYRKQGARLGEP